MSNNSLKEIKTAVRSLIMSQPNKFYTISELQKDYKNEMGHPMPLMGHRNVEHFLRDMPDVVKINGSGPQACLDYIPSVKSSHIGQMVKEQKKNTGKGQRRQPRNMQRSYHFEFPQRVYSEASSWNPPIQPKKSIPQETALQCDKKLNSNICHDNESPALDKSCKTAASDEQQKTKSSRARLLYFMRKKFEEESSSSQSSSSAHSVANEEHTRPTAYTGYRRILERIRQNEAQQETNKPTARIEKLMSRTHPEILSQRSDKEEAVPAYAVTDIIESMYPLQISQIESGPDLFKIKIPKMNIDEKFETGDILSLMITEIDNPFLFYFNLTDESNDFQEFQSDLQNFYKLLLSTLGRGEYVHSVHHLYEGAACAAFFEDNWHRAKICSVPENASEIENNHEFSLIKLFLVDRGSYCELPIRYLRLLAPQFSRLPAQAICARLANIEPKYYSRESEASRAFQRLTREKSLYGYVKSIGPKNQVELILLDSSVEPKLRIHEELLKAGLVEKDESTL